MLLIIKQFSMKIFFTLLFIFSAFALNAQNLVPNPSFEDYLICPVNLDNIDNCTDWSSYRDSPDYWNGCSTNGLNVPNCTFGYQYAHTGVGMAGLTSYYKDYTYREFIGSQLINPLIQGQKYYLSFFTNFSNSLQVAIASNNLGLKLSTVAYSKINPCPINNISQLNYSTVIVDSINWTEVSGSFVADSAYNYIILGNFYADSLTSSLNLGITPDFSYYYIDDVCVSLDSLYCQTWTNANLNLNKNKIKIYPNPVLKDLTITQSALSSFRILNVLGQVIVNGEILSDDYNIDLSNLKQGVYFIVISNNHYEFVSKIFKT